MEIDICAFLFALLCCKVVSMAVSHLQPCRSTIN